MSRHIIAICDSADYVNHFLAFIKTNKSVPFETVGFTDTDALREYIRVHSVDIVLLSEEMFLAEGKGEMDSVKTVAYLGEQQDLSGEVKYLCKYRAAKLILGDLLDIFFSGVHEVKKTSAFITPVYGIFSLDGLGEKVKLAATLVDKLSKDGNVLYINLEQFSGLGVRFKVRTDASLSDLIYYYKTGSEIFRRTIIGAVTQIFGADTILAPDSPEDLDELSPDDWGHFLERLSTEGNYSAVILDIPESSRNLISFFDYCKVVYLICRTDNEGDWRKNAFRSFFEKNGREDILGKVCEGM